MILGCCKQPQSSGNRPLFSGVKTPREMNKMRHLQLSRQYMSWRLLVRSQRSSPQIHGWCLTACTKNLCFLGPFNIPGVVHCFPLVLKLYIDLLQKLEPLNSLSKFFNLDFSNFCPWNASPQYAKFWDFKNSEQFDQANPADLPTYLILTPSQHAFPRAQIQRAFQNLLGALF